MFPLLNMHVYKCIQQCTYFSRSRILPIKPNRLRSQIKYDSSNILLNNYQCWHLKENSDGIREHTKDSKRPCIIVILVILVVVISSTVATLAVMYLKQQGKVKSTSKTLFQKFLNDMIYLTNIWSLQTKLLNELCVNYVLSAKCST